MIFDFALSFYRPSVAPSPVTCWLSLNAAACEARRFCDPKFNRFVNVLSDITFSHQFFTARDEALLLLCYSFLLNISTYHISTCQHVDINMIMYSPRRLLQRFLGLLRARPGPTNIHQALQQVTARIFNRPKTHLGPRWRIYFTREPRQLPRRRLGALLAVVTWMASQT